MNNKHKQYLPKILVLDDQFGRCGLGKQFRSSVSHEVFAGYEADRKNLCASFGLIDVTGDAHSSKPRDCLAEAIFCPAQRWDQESGRIENDYETARKMVSRGWPFNDGSRWALILLDLRFAYGQLNSFGDPQEGSLFGSDVMLPQLRVDFGDDLPIVVLSSTNKGENNTLVRQLGALDFIQRIPGPGAPPDEAHATLSKVLNLHGLLQDSTNTVNGHSLPILNALRQARRAAISVRNILLLGETGTGKGRFARYIHQVSGRPRNAFNVFHVGPRPRESFADELFGHWKGAFPGAEEDLMGLWERADGGTLFIEEVSDIDNKYQQALLRPINEGRVQRIGIPPKGVSKSKTVDVLTVLASSRDLDSASEKGVLNEDFLDRSSIFTIEIPPLRERREDIPTLVEYLASAVVPDSKIKFMDEALDVLADWEWRKSNIRELRNVVEHIMVNNPNQDITAYDVNKYHKNSAAHNTRIYHNKMHAPLTRLYDLFEQDPKQLSEEDIEAIKQDISNVFPHLIAEFLITSLKITQEDGILDPTAAARILSGDPDLSTDSAIEFIQQLLMLDTKDKIILRTFENSEIHMQDEILASVVAACKGSQAGSCRNRLMKKDGSPSQ